MTFGTFDIPLFKVLMSDDASYAAQRVLRSGFVAQGPEVDAFELALGVEFEIPASRVVTVNSGTSALHLAYHLAGVRTGDTVIVTPMTCTATITPLVHLGARLVWADVDRITGNIDPGSVATLLERIQLGRIPSRRHQPACVVAVDWAGMPANYEELRSVVPIDIPIIEDAAHAFGAERLVPGEGWLPITHEAVKENIYTCFSFQAIKHLTTGDGGCVVVPAHCGPGQSGIDRARRLRWFGLDRTSKKDFRCEQDIFEAGYKFHMNDIAAAIGRANIPSAKWAIPKHRLNAHTYCAAFGDLAPRVMCPHRNSGSAWWIYTLLVDDRASFQAWMAERGIQTSQVHRRNDEHTAFRMASAEPPSKSNLPGVDYFSSHQVSIPVGWWLADPDVSRVIDEVCSWANR